MRTRLSLIVSAVVVLAVVGGAQLAAAGISLPTVNFPAWAIHPPAGTNATAAATRQ